MESNVLSSFRRKHPLHEDAKMAKNDFLEVLVSLHETSFPQRSFLLNHCDSLTTKVPILRAWSLRPSILDFFQRIVWLTWDSSKYLRATFLVQNVTFDSICSILQFPPRRVLLSITSEILKQLYRLMRRCKKPEKIWPVNLHKAM